MTLIRHIAAWLDTGEAVSWLKLSNPNGEIRLERIDPHGISLTATDGPVLISIGVASPDLVKLGRYLLSVAAAQGQDINEGFKGGVN